MKTLVIGANGQIGRIFCSKAHQAGFSLRAMVRESGQTTWFQEQGIETVVADIEGDFQGALHGCDQVVFTAGAGAKGGPVVDTYIEALVADLGRAVKTVKSERKDRHSGKVVYSDEIASGPGALT
ncbi:MAG: NAD(P)H-binding protein [Proteobacteria bacterium]|nr:NAD(P)H-binding protein [Pseudomonadota bacterium]